MEDMDADVFRSGVRKGLVTHITRLEAAMLRAVLECAANADDTTHQQSRHLRDAVAALP